MSRPPAPALLLMTCLQIACFVGCQRPAAPTVDVAGATGTVTIEVSMDGETKSWTVDDVATGTTVEEVMRSIEDLPVEISGSGQTAFVQSLGGKSTSGGEGWTYKVDDDFVMTGIGSTKLSPPTTVAWTFGSGSFE